MVNPTVLVDTNVLIAAMLGSHTARKVLHAILNTPCSWLTSPKLIDELSNVPLRPKFQGIITSNQVRDMLDQLRRHAKLIHPKTSVQVCRDPRDNHVLAAAIDGHATYLISGDRDLLTLSPFRGLAVVTPAEFLSQLED